MSNPRPIKVLIVAPALPMVGGQAVQAVRLLDKFREEAELQVDLQPVNPVFLPALQKIKYVRTILTSSKYLFDLLVKIPRYDVIHIFSASYFSFLLAPTPAVLIAKLFGKRAILNYHSGEAVDHLSNWKTAVPIIRLFDRTIVPSGYLVDVFAKFGLNAEPIANFINPESFTRRERDPLRPVFLSNRNFEELYNVGCVLRAFGIIQKKYADARLIVAGDGAEKEKIHQLAKGLLLENVEFLGSVQHKEMASLYDRADIYLNGSSIDNMPNSIIEAFAAGTPVVSTNAGGIPYVVTDDKTGLLVEVNDHEALARMAIELLKQPELARRIIAEASAESSKYTWENVKEKWLALYRDLGTSDR